MCGYLGRVSSAALGRTAKGNREELIGGSVRKKTETRFTNSIFAVVTTRVVKPDLMIYPLHHVIGSIVEFFFALAYRMP